MELFKLYKTCSYGGMEGRDLEWRAFPDEKLAREDALKETYNDGFELYEVVYFKNGNEIDEIENFICRIPCGRDALMVDVIKQSIERTKIRIEDIANNKHMGEKRKEKEIEFFNRVIANQLEDLVRLEKLLENV